MQTFLPYEDFVKSAQCLDYRRLGKQRVEARQLINTFTPDYNKKGWLNHPARLMWEGYLSALIHYHNIMIREWIGRGYNNNMVYLNSEQPIIMPPWIGDKDFHDSHKSNLLRKDPEHYGKFGWGVDPSAPYIWPSNCCLC